jgi:hypothetical protein
MHAIGENLSYCTRYTVKQIGEFPAPSLDVTNQTLPGREQFISWPGSVWLVTSRLGKGKLPTFYTV